jgi:hypothetical protein
VIGGNGVIDTVPSTRDSIRVILGRRNITRFVFFSKKMRSLCLPKYQYTARDVVSGAPSTRGSLNNFLHKTLTYQLYFNIARKNSYKNNKTPLEIIQERNNSVTQNIFLLPPLLLDSINKNCVIENKHSGGCHIERESLKLYFFCFLLAF